MMYSLNFILFVMMTKIKNYHLYFEHFYDYLYGFWGWGSGQCDATTADDCHFVGLSGRVFCHGF